MTAPRPPNAAQRRQARRDPHAGEPLVRPLLRHAVRGPGLLGPDVLTRPPAATYPIFDQFGYQPGAASERPVTCNRSTCRATAAERRRDHQRHHPQLGPAARELEQRRDGPVHDLHLAADGSRQRPGHHGLLHPGGPGLLLRAGRRVHDLRRVPLLGARPDRPQPRDGHLRLDRPGRVAGGPVLATADDRVGRVRASSAGRPCPEQLLAAGVSWKVYNDPTGLLGLSPLPYFKTYINPPPSPARAGRQGAHPDLPGRLRGRRRPAPCPPCRGSCRRSPSASTRPRRRSTASTSSSRSSTPSSSNPDVWARPCSS